MKLEKPKRERPVFAGAQLVPLMIYLFGISAGLMYVLCRSQMALFTVIMSVLTCGLALLFALFKSGAQAKRKVCGAVGLSAVIVLAVLLNGYISYFVEPFNEKSLMDFIFTSSSFFNFGYAIQAALDFSLIISFVTSYSVIYNPRPGMLLLPAFIPLILSARTAGGIPEWILIIIAAGYITTAAGIARREPPSAVHHETAPDAKRQRLAAILAAGGVLAALLVIIPRSSETPRADELDKLSAPAGGYRQLSAGLTNFASNSTVNRGGNEAQGKLLFTVDAKRPLLLKRWCFDEYGGSDGWYNSESRRGYPSWQTDAVWTDFGDLASDLKTALDDGGFTEYADALAELEYSTDGVRAYSGQTEKAYIKSMDGSSVAVILHPERTFKVEAPAGMTTYRTSSDEIFTEADMPEYTGYKISYYADEPNLSLINALDDIGYRTLIEAAYNGDVITASQYTAYLQEYNDARRYRGSYGADSGGVTDEIRRLAAEITDGLYTDYEKALAIERWFGEAGFVYDKDFVPALAEADYFIFKSRRGICSDFATASVLLARAAGLTARYTEGYALSEDIRGEDGLFYVTDEQTHAWASVYINGYGWLTVDGTLYAEPAQADTGAGRTALVIALCAALALAVLAVIFRRKLAEAWFRAAFRFGSRQDRLVRLYGALRRLSCRISGRSAESATVGEVCAAISGALGMPEEAARLEAAFNALFYNGDDGADPDALYADYKRAYAMKRRLGR